MAHRSKSISLPSDQAWTEEGRDRLRRVLEPEVPHLFAARQD